VKTFITDFSIALVGYLFLGMIFLAVVAGAFALALDLSQFRYAAF
jgi:hypothetical protein